MLNVEINVAIVVQCAGPVASMPQIRYAFLWSWPFPRLPHPSPYGAMFWLWPFLASVAGAYAFGVCTGALAISIIRGWGPSSPPAPPATATPATATPARAPPATAPTVTALPATVDDETTVTALPATVDDASDLYLLSCDELRVFLRSRCKAVTGVKKDLIARIKAPSSRRIRC